MMTVNNLETENLKTIQSSIMMTVILVTFSMLFATLCMSYMVLRMRSATWPPMGMTQIGLTIPSVSTVIIFLSSICYFQFEKIYNRGCISKLYYGLTLFFGISFSISQCILWAQLNLMGIKPSTGIFGSILYGFTWIHAVHIVIGLILLSWLPFSLKKLNLGEIKGKLRAKNVGLFWHFLGVVWGVLYLMLFVF